MLFEGGGRGLDICPGTTRDFGTFRISSEQRRLRRVCACRCLPMHCMNVDKCSDKNLDL